MLTAVAGGGRPVPTGAAALLRQIAADAPPSLAGLRARHWRREGRTLVGRYLFDDEDTLERFVGDRSSDPAIGAFAELGQPVSVATIERCPQSSPFDRPIFLVSAPRAGSTLLYDLLSMASSVWTVDGESHGVIEGVPSLHPASRRYDSHRLTDEDADVDVVKALHAGFMAEARQAARGRRYLSLEDTQRPPTIRLLEKTPENSLRIPFLAAAFPDARFVFLHRNARQNVSSLVEAWGHEGFVKFPYLSGWEGPWCFLLPPGWRALRGLSLSQVAAHQWYAANERALDDLAALPRDRWTVVEYADLIAVPEKVVRGVCEFAELDVAPRLADALSRPLPITSTTITPPSPLKWRTNAAFDPSALARMGPLMGRLRHLSSPSTAARPAPEHEVAARMRYACLLVDLTGEKVDTPARVDPSVLIQLGPTPPLAIARKARHRDRFLADQPLVWVEDPRTDVLYPFWGRREDAWWLRRLRPGASVPDEVPQDAVASLAAAGAVGDAQSAAEARRAGQALVGQAGEDYASEAWCVLPAVLHPGHAAALRAYYRPAITAGSWELGDEQVERRHGWYNEPIARYFQWQFRQLVGRIVGEPVKPTYSYTSAYRGGATLKAHVDREQCEFTLSLLVDRTCGPEDRGWPLWFQGRDGKVALNLGVGDAVLFAGCELPHWREPAPDDQDQTMLLFHYVPATFAGVLA